MATGLVRLAAGAGLVSLAPTLARFAGARTDDRVTPAVLRGFGIRDTALGISAIVASRPGGDVKRQLRLQAGLDAVDASVCGWLVRSGRLPKVRGVACAATAVASGIVELALARQIDSPVAH